MCSLATIISNNVGNIRVHEYNNNIQCMAIVRDYMIKIIIVFVEVIIEYSIVIMNIIIKYSV